MSEGIAEKQHELVVNSEEDEECAICLSSLSISESRERTNKSISLSCNHSFHFDCFRQLLEVSGDAIRCPLCRQAPDSLQMPSGDLVTIRCLISALKRISSSSSNYSGARKRSTHKCCVCLDKCDNVYFSSNSNEVSTSYTFSVMFDSLECSGNRSSGCGRAAHLVCAFDKYSYSSSAPLWYCHMCASMADSSDEDDSLHSLVSHSVSQSMRSNSKSNIDTEIKLLLDETKEKSNEIDPSILLRLFQMSKLHSNQSFRSESSNSRTAPYCTNNSNSNANSNSPHCGSDASIKNKLAILKAKGVASSKPINNNSKSQLSRKKSKLVDEIEEDFKARK